MGLNRLMMGGSSSGLPSEYTVTIGYLNCYAGENSVYTGYATDLSETFGAISPTTFCSIAITRCCIAIWSPTYDPIITFRFRLGGSKVSSKLILTWNDTDYTLNWNTGFKGYILDDEAQVNELAQLFSSNEGGTVDISVKKG